MINFSAPNPSPDGPLFGQLPQRSALVAQLMGNIMQPLPQQRAAGIGGLSPDAIVKLAEYFKKPAVPPAPGTAYGPSDYYGGGYSDPSASSDYSGGVPLAF